MKHRTITTLALFAGLLALGGCGASQAGSESATPPTNQLPAEQEWITGEWENWAYSSFVDSEIGSPFSLNADGTGTINPDGNVYPNGLHIEWSLDGDVLNIEVPATLQQSRRDYPIVREVRGDAERLYLGQPGYGTAVYQRDGMAILPPSSDAAASNGERPLLQAWLPTILDDGDGPKLCLGVIMQSLPPQCGGPKLIGWDWNSVPRDSFETASGVRWGTFHVTGYYDAAANTFEIAEVLPGGEFFGDQPAAIQASGQVDFTSPCDPPEGGWRVIDPEFATDAALNDAITFANSLPGVAGVWLDQTQKPNPDGPDNDPKHLILNVRVTGDLSAAEARLREVWGGMLCVSPAIRTSVELAEIQNSLPMDGMLSSSQDVTTGTIELWVIYDEGTLQRQLDAEHGPGVVRVISALQPAS